MEGEIVAHSPFEANQPSYTIQTSISSNSPKHLLHKTLIHTLHSHQQAPSIEPSLHSPFIPSTYTLHTFPTQTTHTPDLSRLASSLALLFAPVLGVPKIGAPDVRGELLRDRVAGWGAAEGGASGPNLTSCDSCLYCSSRDQTLHEVCMYCSSIPSRPLLPQGQTGIHTHSIPEDSETRIAYAP